jgi:hypothetical protein
VEAVGTLAGNDGDGRESVMAMLTGRAADWLAARRQDLNARFVRARKRHPRLQGDEVKATVAAVLPALVGDEPRADAFCETVYDLILLHAGRGSFATQPGLGILLREVFPRLRPHLLARPSSLPQELSNAVENLGPRGADMARGLGALGALVSTPAELRDAGVVLAWRLGEARLRTAALAVAAKLPPSVVAAALGYADWPEAAIALAVAALSRDAWHAPEAHAQALVPDAGAALHAVARLGDFAGLGGSFEQPPVLLAFGNRHRFYVRSGSACFAIDADAFGQVCRPVADPGVPIATPGRDAAKLAARVPDSGERSHLAGATSLVVFDGVVAATSADSHRVRVFAPRGASSA